MRRTLPAVLLFVLLGRGLQAQEPVTCKPDETFGQCRERWLQTGSGLVRAELARRNDRVLAAGTQETAHRLNAKHSGPDLSAGGPSAIRDFLPRISAALLTPTTGLGAGDFGVRLNVPMSGTGRYNPRSTLQLGLVMHKPEIATPVLGAVPAGRRSAAKDELASHLGAFDDVSVTGALNLETRHFGRSLRPLQDEVGKLLASILAPVLNGPQDSDMQGFTDFVRQIDRALKAPEPSGLAPDHLHDSHCVLRTVQGGPGAEGVLDLPPACLTPAVQLRIRRWIAVETGATQRSIELDVALVGTSGFNRIAQLVNNQPQLNVTGEYRGRRAVSGASEWTGRARWEMGFGNMNGLRKRCAIPDAACLENYLKSPRTRWALDHAARMWGQVDLHRRNRWRVDLPRDSVHFSQRVGATYALSGGYGQYFGNAKDGDSRDRIDLDARYDAVRNDPLRQDRLVASASYTRRLSDESSAVFGFRYANRPEFLGDVDHRFGGNVGFTYKISQPAKR